MKVKEEISLKNFEFWSGAVEHANMLTCEELDAVEAELEVLDPEGMEKTYINDLFWFDFGYICDLIGLEYDEGKDEVNRDDSEWFKR